VTLNGKELPPISPVHLALVVGGSHAVVSWTGKRFAVEIDLGSPASNKTDLLLGLGCPIAIPNCKLSASVLEQRLTELGAQ
jgi:hypothetical protein